MAKLMRDAPMLHRISALLLILFLIGRSLLVILTIEHPEGGLTLDSQDYIDLSRSIRFQGAYTDPEGETDLRRPPIFPVFLALFQTKSGLQQTLVSLAQLILASLISLMVLWFYYARGFAKEGLLASWLIAISPNMNLWSLTIMSEVLFTFLLAIAIMIFLIALEKSSGFASCFAGVLLGLATLTRPIGLVIVGLWVLIYLLASFARWSPGLNFRLGIGFILGCATVILPWMARNAAAHQRFVVSDIGSHTLESFNFAIVLSEAEDITRNEATYILGDVGGTWDQFSWIISKYPVDFLRSQIAGASRVLGGTEITRWATVSGRENWDGFGVFRNLRKGEFGAGWENLVDTLQTPAERWLLFIYLLSILHTMVLVLLSIVCLASFSRFDVNRRFLILFCIGTSLGLILMSGAAGQARFRVPVEPMLAMTAGLGALKLARRRGKKVFEQ